MDLAWRTTWSRSNFLKSDFTSSLLGEEENIVLQCKLGHTVRPQNPKNNVWSVLWARELEQVPELLATVLILVSLALVKIYFSIWWLFFFWLVVFFSLFACFVGDFWVGFFFFWWGVVWGILFVCFFNLSMCLHAYLLLVFFRWINLFPLLIQCSWKDLYMFLIITFLFSNVFSLEHFGKHGQFLLFLAMVTGK